MKNILLLATGGTIASKKSESGLTPLMTSEEILSYVSLAPAICHVDTLQLFNIDSSSIEPKHWCMIAGAIRDHYHNYDGFVILHGTDTMSYTAAALSYLIQKSPKPIVFTGAQHPIDQETTDAKLNLSDSLLYASDEDSHDVTIVFGGHVIAGTRAKKIRTKSFNAFSSINYPDIAQIRSNRIIRYIRQDYDEQMPEVHLSVNPRVFVLKLIPGINTDIFEFLKPSCDAVVIESFGVGGIPCSETDSFMKAVGDWVAAGKLLVVTTQVPHEGSDMEVYQVGSRIKEKYELIESYDMTLEAVITKLMWIMYDHNDFSTVKHLFYTPVNHDIIT